MARTINLSWPDKNILESINCNFRFNFEATYDRICESNVVYVLEMSPSLMTQSVPVDMLFFNNFEIFQESLSIDFYQLKLSLNCPAGTMLKIRPISILAIFVTIQ